MKISTKGRYALRLMLDIAQNSSGEFIRLKDISKRQQVSEKYLEQITGMLSKMGFIKGVRGAQGGYKLVKDPSEYTIGAILRATEGSMAPIACLDNEENICQRKDKCITLGFWQEFDKVINNFLESKTLQNLLDDGKSVQSQYII